ncbi:MAG: hypothetical protein HRU11_10870, partial [Parvularculaceae bacterium]|nr:hypothetical protein [Parvularculaceae bacterium]
MNIISAKYNEDGSIKVVHSDGEMYVPSAPGNRHYGMIMTWLGETDDNQIEEYVAPAKERRMKGTAREFMDIFTTEEKIKIVGLTMSDPAIKLWYDEALAGEVWLNHPDVALVLGAMQLAGVITAERAAEILATDFDA